MGSENVGPNPNAGRDMGAGQKTQLYKSIFKK